MGKKTFLIFGIVCLLFLQYHGYGYAAELEVGDNKPFQTITSAIASASDGDIIKVFPGLYKEKLELNKQIILQSVEKHKAIIEGDHKKHVIEIKSPDVVIKGFKIRASGHNFLNNDAAILVDQADHAQIVDNVMEDILFGVYIDSGNNTIITGNEIYGLKDKRLSERGNGIHFFNTNGNEVNGNVIKNVRDGMYFDHANETEVTNNKITDVRYGLHYMWSNDNTFRENYFSNNVSGAAIMFSKFISLEKNIFADNRGYRAFGMFFQTAEESIVEDNLFMRNSIGIYSDLSRGNIIRNNTVVQNDIGIEILGSNWDDEIYGNSFIDNLQHASVNEMKIRDKWYKDGEGNFWSDYSGVDIEKDGIGDAEYHSGSAFEFLMYKYPHLRLFVESPTSKMLKAIDKMFPVIDRAEVIDPYPLKVENNSASYVKNMKIYPSKVAGIMTFVISLMVTAIGITFITYLSKRFSH
ncbi:nitrous oxide reductase family maturation protein NosD [Calidifontibacillus oryziterrae]|uniref:nitrous oxide reductase family maturation protein NosD n=1 Tax=Calidifontibacillus oryziterrae TaxID=1191699 RepID=UPI0002DE4C85|nr:nitrous oxide reductase family maturation protein NosD [Calidifontibacillus oryziterrae]